MRSRKKKKHLCFIAGLMLLTVFIGVILYIGFNYILDKIQEPKYVVLEAEKNHKITWNDSVLENKIRKNINRKDGDIYLSDLWDVCFLNIGRNIELEPKEDIAKQIEDISSLEGLENLRILNLKNHAVTDIRVISSMKSLENLDLCGNQIQDLSPVKSLKYLEDLDLTHTGIQGKDLECLSKLKKLRTLILDLNEIDNLEALRDLNLNWLSANKNKITDVTPLVSLDKCSYLHLIDNQITDIKPLSELKGLENLDLTLNKIIDISPLCKLRNISYLYLNNNQITVLPDFSKMVSLRVLYLNNNQISTEEWKNIKLPYSIERVHISGNTITDLETNKKYPYLEVIFEE